MSIQALCTSSLAFTFKGLEEDLTFPHIGGLLLYVQGNFVPHFHIFSFQTHFISTHVPINIFWIIVVPLKGTCICDIYGYQILLWRGLAWKWHILCKVARIDGEGNGISEKGTLLNFL